MRKNTITSIYRYFSRHWSYFLCNDDDPEGGNSSTNVYNEFRFPTKNYDNTIINKFKLQRL